VSEHDLRDFKMDTIKTISKHDCKDYRIDMIMEKKEMHSIAVIHQSRPVIVFEQLQGWCVMIESLNSTCTQPQGSKLRISMGMQQKRFFAKSVGNYVINIILYSNKTRHGTPSGTAPGRVVLFIGAFS